MNLMFWKKKKPAESDGDQTEAIASSANTGKSAPEATQETGDEAANLAIKRIRNKKRMILAAMAGGAVLLLAAIGITAWMLLSAPEKAEDASAEKGEHPASDEAHKPDDSEHEPDLKTQLDELKKQNEKLAAELEAAKKGEHADQENTGEAATGEQAGNGDGAAKKANEITFSSQDPKGSAQALKQAIEQMNAEDKRGQGK